MSKPMLTSTAYTLMVIDNVDNVNRIKPKQPASSWQAVWVVIYMILMDL